MKLEKADYERKKALQVLWSDAPIEHVGAEVWRVPSLSRGGEYHTVNLSRDTCTCEKWRSKYRASQKNCHHIIAVKMYLAKVRVADGGSVDDPENRAPFGRPNPYRNPAHYDYVATRQGDVILELARCLTMPLSDRIPDKSGRPPAHIGDVMFSLLLKAYSNKASRRAISEPHAWPIEGFSKAPLPHYKTLLRYQADPQTTVVLRDLHKKTVELYRTLETTFSIDSKTLKSPYSRLRRQVRTGAGSEAQLILRVTNVKAHFASGRKTHAIVAAEVSDGDDHDINHFRPLFATMARLFRIDEVLADAAYSDAELYEMVHAHGGRAFINFNANARQQVGFPHYNEMLDLLRNESTRDEWFENYSLRNNAESTNSAFGRTRGRIVRAQGDLTRVNEVLAGVIVYNLGVIPMAVKSFGIEVPFADQRALTAVHGSLAELTALRRSA